MAKETRCITRTRSVVAQTGEARLVLATAGGEEQAAAIARALVSERLAACVNVIAGARSIYRWREAIEDEREWLMLIKTTADRYPALERRVRELHTYETPEVIALPIVDGSAPYLQWLAETTAPPALEVGRGGATGKARPPRR